MRPHYTTEYRPKQEIAEENYDTGDEDEKAKKGNGGVAGTTIVGGEAICIGFRHMKFASLDF